MLVQLPSTASGMRKVVSRIIITDMPSTPRRNVAPHCGIHDAAKLDCHTGPVGSYDHHSPAESTNSSRRTIRATIRGKVLTGMRVPAVTVSLVAASPTTTPDD